MRVLRTDQPGLDIDAVTVGAAGFAHFPGGVDSLVRDVRTVTGARVVSVTSDIVPSFVGAIGLLPGAVLAAGTGAIALGSDMREVLRRVDGRGHLLGDHGSGAWIGLHA